MDVGNIGKSFEIEGDVRVLIKDTEIAEDKKEIEKLAKLEGAEQQEFCGP